MVNRALHRVRELMDLIDLHEPNYERKVRWIADFYREGYPTRDAEMVERDAERVAGIWTQEHFKKLQAQQDRDEDDQT